MVIKKIEKIILILPFLIFFLTFTPVQPIKAATASELFADNSFWGGREGEIQLITGLGSQNPVLILASLIRIALGFVGIIAMLMIILGGLKWMVSAGDEDRADEARNMIVRAIIGMVLVLASFAIAQYLINNLAAATGA